MTKVPAAVLGDERPAGGPDDQQETGATAWNAACRDD